MPRRADLVLRTKSLQDFLPLDHLKWLSLAEAVEYNSEDFYVSGTIVKIFPIVLAKSNSWNYKENHLGIRKGMLVRDNAPNADKKRAQFSVMFYGTYAQDIDQLVPKEGEVLTVANPTGFAPMLLQDDDDNYLQDYKVLVGQRFKLDSKVCFHSELPSVYLKKLALQNIQNTDNLLVKKVTISPRVNAPQQKQSNVVYDVLKDCTDSKRKYNAFGVVSKISRDPLPTRSGRYMSQVYIRDPESSGTFGFSDYQFSLLAADKEHIPSVVVNAILRIHGMKPEMYEGNLTFRVFDARSVTVFNGGVNDPIVPESKQVKPMEFTEDERRRVVHLRKWWREESRRVASGAKDSQGMTQDMIEESSTIQPNLPFDLFCQVIKVQPTALTVTDGKKCALNLLFHDDTFGSNRKELTIFITGGNKIPNSIKCGQFLQIREIQCVSSTSDGCYKLVCQFRPHQDFKVLPETNRNIRELKKALLDEQNKNSQQIEEITNDTLKDLFDSQISLDIQSQPFANNTHRYPANQDASIIVPSSSSDESQSQPFVKAYPSNLDGVLIPASDDEQSQEFYTCPENYARERLSPSPDREEEPFAMTTNTNFPWTCIEELLKNEDEKSNTFRVKGYVRQFVYGRDWKSNLVLLCTDCCTVTKYDRGKKQCQDCQCHDLSVIYHFQLILEEYRPMPLPRKSPTIKLFLCGSHATRLLGMEAEEYTQTAMKRAQINQKLESLTDKLVVVSITRARDSSMKSYGYQIVNSYFAN